MSSQVIDAAALQIGEHVREWNIPELTVIFHGGEPLLAGVDTITYAIERVKAAVSRAAKVTFSLQTNGLLLDRSILEVLARNWVRVGISLDGDRLSNDRHRRFADGRGSFRKVAAAIELINSHRYRHLFSGLLCVVDLQNDPDTVYDSLASFRPSRIDLLLPHGNWDNPPPFRSTVDDTAPYGEWLIRVFDRWCDASYPKPDIRLFTSIMSLLVGGASGVESVGLDPIRYLTIETDGTIEQSDALKTTEPGMPRTGFDVFKNTFSEALGHESIRARQSGVGSLSLACQGCREVGVCGGGLHAHRYRRLAGFANPTVYCADQRILIEHIREYVDGKLGALMAKRQAPDSASSDELCT